jgi:hypothetical protein
MSCNRCSQQSAVPGGRTPRGEPNQICQSQSSSVWHDVTVPDESHSERLRRESDELLETAAKLIEHAATLKEPAAELRKQIAGLERSVRQSKKRA